MNDSCHPDLVERAARVGKEGSGAWSVFSPFSATDPRGHERLPPWPRPARPLLHARMPRQEHELARALLFTRHHKSTPPRAAGRKQHRAGASARSTWWSGSNIPNCGSCQVGRSVETAVSGCRQAIWQASTDAKAKAGSTSCYRPGANPRRNAAGENSSSGTRDHKQRTAPPKRNHALPECLTLFAPLIHDFGGLSRIGETEIQR